MKRIFYVLLIILLTLSTFSHMTFAADINDANVFIKQGSNECTLASVVSMLRRRAIVDNKPNWDSDYSYAKIKSAAWSSSGLSFDFSFGGYQVSWGGAVSGGGSMNGNGSKYGTVSVRKTFLIEALSDHPEGIVIYMFRDKKHAVLLTDYDSATGTFYCFEPANTYGGNTLPHGRIKLENSILYNYIAQKNRNAGLSVQDNIIANIGSIWMITNASGGGNDGLTKPNTPGCANHVYNSSGYCSSCGTEYPISISTMAAATYAAVKDDVPVRARPYAPDAIHTYLPKGTAVIVVGSGYNSVGNLWYKLSDGNWIFSENLGPVQSSGAVTIEYNPNGGSGGPAGHAIAKDPNGDVYFTLATTKPMRGGYTFLGWRLFNDPAYAIDSPGQSIAFGTGNPTSNDTLTYYAQWSPNTGTANSYTLDGYNCTKIEKNMTVNVGAGSTLRFCDAPTSNNTRLSAISNGVTVYVYGATVDKYPNTSGTYITWAKISYNGQAGWVRYDYLK